MRSQQTESPHASAPSTNARGDATTGESVNARIPRPLASVTIRAFGVRLVIPVGGVA